MSTLTLIVIPGPGARSINITNDMTVAELVSRESLHGRDIIINGSGVLPANFTTTLLQENMEVFATGSVKGNSKSRPSNGPSQTGRPSGGGRGNNSPKSK
jgi:hypothetical protein